jgi:hypothetical protein
VWQPLTAWLGSISVEWRLGWLAMWCRAVLVVLAAGAVSVASAGLAPADDGEAPAPPSPGAQILPGGAMTPVGPSQAGDALAAGLPAPVAGLASPGGPLSAEGPLLSPDGPLSAHGPLTAAGGPLSTDGPLLSPSSPVSPVNGICGSGNILKSVAEKFAGVVPDGAIVPDGTLAAVQTQLPVDTGKCPAPPSAQVPAADQGEDYQPGD